jgi:hypothetical protein
MTKKDLLKDVKLGFLLPMKGKMNKVFCGLLAMIIVNGFTSCFTLDGVLGRSSKVKAVEVVYAAIPYSELV